MNRKIIKSRVGGDGDLKVIVPMGMADANREVDIPTPLEIQECFRNTIIDATGATTCLELGAFARYCRIALNPIFENRAGVGVMQVKPRLVLIQAIRLFRIDKHLGGQREKINAEIGALAECVCKNIPNGASLSLRFDFSPTKSVPFGIEFASRVLGIVR